MHFPLFQIFPLFSENFQTLRKIFTILPFPDKFLDFHPPKFLMTPCFPCFNTFPPCFAKIIISPPTLTNFPPCFRQIHLLFTYFTCISFPPYFDHDAFMHHPMHVLYAPELDHKYLDCNFIIIITIIAINIIIIIIFLLFIMIIVLQILLFIHCEY